MRYISFVLSVLGTGNPKYEIVLFLRNLSIYVYRSSPIPFGSTPSPPHSTLVLPSVFFVNQLMQHYVQRVGGVITLKLT